MKTKQFKGKRYPVEYLIFQCRCEEEAKKYLDLNDIWTEALSQHMGFISSNTYLNNSVPGEVHIVIVWETLDSWLSIAKEELQAIDAKFNEAFPYPYEAKGRLHIDTNFGYYKVSHFEIEGEA